MLAAPLLNSAQRRRNINILDIFNCQERADSAFKCHKEVKVWAVNEWLVVVASRFGGVGYPNANSTGSGRRQRSQHAIINLLAATALANLTKVFATSL